MIIFLWPGISWPLGPEDIIIITKFNITTGVPGEEDVVDIQYKHGSYLFLAREEGASILEENIAVQKEAGVKVHRF